MAEIDYRSDKTRAHEKAEGSDGRLNVSSRADSRAYYNSRDEGQTYSFGFTFTAAEAGEFAAYFKNTSATLTFVPTEIVVGADVAGKVKLCFVSGTAAAGTTVTPTNDNRVSSNAASAIAMEGNSAATGITGLTSDALIETILYPASSSHSMAVSDSVRLGQNDAIAIEYDAGGTATIAGTILGFYE